MKFDQELRWSCLVSVAIRLVEGHICPFWVSDRNDFTYNRSRSCPDTPYQVTIGLSFRRKKSKQISIVAAMVTILDSRSE